jgi:JmjC domain, hydroxylase
MSSCRIVLWTNTLLTSRSSWSLSLDFVLRKFEPSLSRCATSLFHPHCPSHRRLHPCQGIFASTLDCTLTDSASLWQTPSSARSYDVRRLQSWRLGNDEAPWVNSEPVICEGVLSRQQMFLTPSYFIQTFGREKVDLADCESGEFKAGTLEDILKLFDSPHDPHNPVWKVKVRSLLLHVMKLNYRCLDCQDWPSQATFKGGKFAEIYEEFEDCLPFPHLTRLNGHDNLAAHFPDDAGLPPDLGNGISASSCLMANCGDGGVGPKVYFALAAKPDDGHGSTRLHCDLTDAINVCVFAARKSDGSPGGARWDIFSPDDTTRLKTVLRVHDDPEDPILAQNTYLSPSALRELELQHEIKASTFIQHEGDAVFIPAGCAHQVSCSSICATIDHDVKGIGQQRHQHHQDRLRLHLCPTLTNHHRTRTCFSSAPHFQTVWG